MDHNPYSTGDQQSVGNVGLLGPKFDGSIRVMQIISVALMMGVLSFLLVVLVLTQGEVLGLKKPDIISLLAAGFGLVMFVNHLIIPGVIAKQQLKKTAENGLGGTDEESQSFKVAGIYQTQLIVALAMLEAAAFFNLVAMLVEKNGLNLIVVVVLLSLMLMKFPTRTKVSWWVQDRLKELQT